MFFRNGILSILRERGRTALFSLLITLLTVTLILSVSVLLYCNGVMTACDDAYRSVALVEYMGSEYPTEDEPDAAARAAAKALTSETVLSVPGVTAWTRGNVAFASAEGYERPMGSLPYGNRAVIVVSRMSAPINQWVKFDANNQPIVDAGSLTYYSCILKTALYSRRAEEGTYIDIVTNDSGFVPEKGKSYVLNGSFLDISGTASKVGNYPMNGFSVFQVESFLSSDDLPYADYVDGEEIPEAFVLAAEQYRRMNNYVRVVPCRDVNDVYAFHQNEIQLAEGDMPDPQTPYACVITDDLAKSLDLQTGDTFSMEELRATEEDIYYLTATGEKQTYTVCGVAVDSSDFKGTVWTIAQDADTPLFGYLLGTASLVNAEAEEAVETLRSLVPEQVRVTLLDQGYGSTVQPFREVRKTAVNVLIVCSAGIAAILLLFAFLYVGRQNSTVKIMVSLGTPKHCITRWFLSGALVICSTASILGTVLGTVLRPTIFGMIADSAAQKVEGILWYSETVLGVVKQTAFDPQVPLWPNLLAVPAIVALALLFCMRFLRMAHQSGTPKRGKTAVHIPRGKSAALPLGGLGFSLLAIRRNGLRSLIVPLVSLVLTVTVLVLGGVYQGWQNSLDDALENERIEGMVVSLDGRYHSNLVVSVSNVRKLLNTEGVDDVAVSYGYNYWLVEDEPNFSKGDYGRQRRQEWIDMQPDLVALNSLSAAKEFYYTDADVIWLEGWDESALADAGFTPIIKRSTEAAEEKHIPAVCSETFLEEHGLALGDTFVCYAKVERSSTTWMEVPLNLRVIASYVQQGGKAHIYVPLACYITTSLLTSDEDPLKINRESAFTFQTCRFHLTSAGELETVRKQLREQRFSAVGRISGNRTTLLLRDSAFLILKENMERNIAMGKVMSAVISLMIVLLGFIVSWLMIFSRRREFALMRGFGAKKRQVFASFFLEQAILSLAGCGAGCILLIWLYAGGIVQPLAAAVYLICYLLGTAISIRIIGKTDLMELMTVRE